MCFSDLIVDEYISCESLGMSQEIKLGINAYRQTKILGWCSDHWLLRIYPWSADSSLITVVGKDEGGEFAHQMLKIMALVVLLLPTMVANS